jgi:hypothetical protein
MPQYSGCQFSEVLCGVLRVEAPEGFNRAAREPCADIKHEQYGGYMDYAVNAQRYKIVTQ